MLPGFQQQQNCQNYAASMFKELPLCLLTQHKNEPGKKQGDTGMVQAYATSGMRVLK